MTDIKSITPCIRGKPPFGAHPKIRHPASRGEEPWQGADPDP